MLEDGVSPLFSDSSSKDEMLQSFSKQIAQSCDKKTMTKSHFHKKLLFHVKIKFLWDNLARKTVTYTKKLKHKQLDFYIKYTTGKRELT